MYVLDSEAILGFHGYIAGEISCRELFPSDGKVYMSDREGLYSIVSLTPRDDLVRSIFGNQTLNNSGGRSARSGPGAGRKTRASSG